MYFAHPIDYFFALPTLKKKKKERKRKKKYEFIRYGFSLVWFLMVLILIGDILEQSINNKMVSKTSVRMSTTDMYFTLIMLMPDL